MTLLNTPYDPREIIAMGSERLGITLPPRALQRMWLHMQMIQRWKKRIDLTALTDPRDMAVRHFLDSLTLFKVLPNVHDTRVLDIGTGAGFPGLVLASVVDTFDLMLLERDPAKIVFLKYVVKALDRTRVRFLNRAILPLLDDPAIDACDMIVSRAFSSDKSLMDRFHVLLKDGGWLLRMMGPGAAQDALTLPHFEVADMWAGTLPFSTRMRKIVLYRKVGPPDSSVAVTDLPVKAFFPRV